MFRSSCLVLLVVFLTISAEQEQDGSYGQRYSQQQGRGDDDTEDFQLKNNRYISHEEHQQTNAAQNKYIQQDEEGPEATRRYMRHQNRLQINGPPDDSATDSSSSYRSVVVHNEPGQQKSSSNMQYQTIRAKPVKNYPKAPRQSFRENIQNSKSYKNGKQADQLYHQTTQQRTPISPASGDPFVHAVHPSIMQSLLKQQPQTFDVPQQNENEAYEQVSSDWQREAENQNVNNRHTFKSFKAGLGLPVETTGQQDIYGDLKRPIYVPNRLSVQKPSSDSSFNVGYSIGFSNVPSRAKLVQNSVPLRQGKEISFPASYQNTPVNVHVDGKNSVWKNMGNGVEMSHNMDAKFKTYKQYGSEYTKDHSSNPVVHQPMIYQEGLQHSFNNIPTVGRNSFDHDHALQQSNSFDFSNAIDPATNLPYTTEQKSIQFSIQSQSSLSDPYAKQSVPLFIDPYRKKSPISYSFSKEPRPSYIESQQKPTVGYNDPSIQYAQTTTLNDESLKQSGNKYETQREERPNYSSNSFASLRNPNTININLKPKGIDFSRNIPNAPKSSFTLNSFANTDMNHVNQDIYANSFGFSGMQIIPQMYTSAGKSNAGGMVSAILVPVNAPTPLPYPIGMPLMGNGYSPYLGHPIGIIRMPENLGLGLPVKDGYEAQSMLVSHPADISSQHSAFQKSSPVKIFQSYNPKIQHQTEQPAESSPYFQRAPNPYLRTDDASDHHNSMKYKRVLTTETPEHPPAGLQPHPHSTGYNSSPDFNEPTSPPYSSVNSHHPRLYRSGSMIIVKRA